MPGWNDPADPVSGTTITRAWAITNVTNLLRWLRILSGNGDPPAAGYVARSLSTVLTDWFNLDGALAARVANATPNVSTFASLIAANKSGFYEVVTAADGPTAGQSFYCLNCVEFNVPSQYGLQIAVNIANQDDAALRVVIAGVAGAWRKLWHAGNDGVGSGLDADMLQGIAPGAMNFVPSGAIVAFETLAELTAAGAGWARYTAADGRLLVGAGTTFGQTFAQATNYGANWTPLTGQTTTADGTNVVLVVPSGGGGATNVNTSTHAHQIPATTFLPPSRGVIWGRKT